MSKNFEILSQLGERYSLFRRPPQLQPKAALQTEEMPPPAQSALFSSVEEAPSAEEARLVERFFILPGPDAPKSVAFCGVDEGEGASLICARVGEILAARENGRVCMIDANLRAPSLYRRYGMDQQFEVADGASEDGVRRPHPVQGRNLWLISAGSRIGDRQKLIAVDGFRSLILELQEQFSTILIAAPPVNLCPDGMLLGQLVEGVILVIKANATRRMAAIKAKEMLEALQVRLLGAVLTDRLYPIPESLYQRLYRPKNGA